MIYKQPKHKKIDLPDRLANIPDPPGQLFVIGNELDNLLKAPRVAIVGSRKMSSYGRGVTEKFANQLANKGIVIVSGLAYGVDACAQKSAIDSGGRVIAVLAHGLDQIYPIANSKLAHNIVEKNGALVSEYPSGTQPLRHHFLARNRLISGLSDVILITEAAERSGSLNTAGHALAQGKTVMAVPGNITSPLSGGTNNLIKSGAQPITSVEDVLLVLGITDKSKKTMPTAVSEEEFVVLTLLHDGLSDATEIQTKSKLTPQMFNQTLTMLEISGKIKPLGNNHWTLN